MSNLYKLVISILVAISSFLLIHPLAWSGPLATSLVLLLSFCIMLGAVYFGTKGIMIFICLGLFTAFLRAISGQQVVLSFPVLLLLTGAIFYLYRLKEGMVTKKADTETDNIEEEKNILSVELDHLRMEGLALKQKLQRYTALKSLTEALDSARSLHEIISLIVNETFTLINRSQVCLLYLVDKQKHELKLVGTKAEDIYYEVKLKKGDIFDNWVFKQRTRLIVMDTKKDFRFSAAEPAEGERNIRSLIAVPLISQNKLVGVLRLDSTSCDTYDSAALRLLDIIGDLAALAIENVRVYQHTEKLAITDGLTGLLVHRHFLERFEQEITRSIWTSSDFAFLMLDIDNFKSYNDRYGHIAGDLVLKQIARLIRATVNPGDLVARYGGEEFAVLLVDISKVDALKLAEDVRKRIENEKFILRREVTQVRISGGISFFPDDGKEKKQLIERADRALYKAKAIGKNRVCIY